MKQAFATFLTFIHKYWLGTALLTYGTGFFFWNLYLSSFGFFEYNLVQSRFLSAGIFFWLPIWLCVLMANYFNEKFPFRKRFKYFIGIIFLISVMLWFEFFLQNFPRIPQYAGGGAPISTTLIGTPDQIAFLKNFDVLSAPNSGQSRSVQTYPVCVIYQNDQYIVFFNANVASSSYKNGTLNISFAPRAIALAREQVLGFQPSFGSYADLECGLSGSLYNNTIQVPVSR